MRRRLWLGLAWLLLARAPGAPGGYPHLEGDVRWRRLFSSTHFFLRVDPGGRVQGTRWRHGQDSECWGSRERWAHIPWAPKQRRGCWVGSVAYLQGKLMRGDSSWDVICLNWGSLCS